MMNKDNSQLLNNNQQSNETLSFNEYCIQCLDGMYEPILPQEAQSTGYTMLKKMVFENIAPASLEEVERWEKAPTSEELLCEPDIKYLRFLHVLLRRHVIEHWDTIKTLKV